MPIIRIEMFEGRDAEQKRNLVREVTRAFVDTAGGSAEAVQVVITDVATSDWGSGGTLWSDKIQDRSS